MGAIFGGSKSSGSSYNVNNGMLTSALAPSLGAVGESYNAISSLLGGDSSGFNKYKDAAGFNFAAKTGAQGVLGNAAARGLLRSGSSGKALVNFGQNLSNQYLDSYLSRLTGLGQLGLGAAGVLSNSGQVSQQSSKSKNGLGGLIGGLASGIASSDRRLKENIVKHRELKDGLGIYTFTYKSDPDKNQIVGVMADEVSRLRPWALGPEIDGFMTVDYGKLWGDNE